MRTKNLTSDDGSERRWGKQDRESREKHDIGMCPKGHLLLIHYS